MPAPRRFAFILLPLFAIGLGAVASGDTARMAVTGTAMPAPPEAAPAEDPFPIARIRVNEEQLAEALKNFEFGPLVRLPRAEFESRVRKAGLAAAEERDPPRIVDATYFASLSGGNLSGYADWTIHNPRSTPAYLSLAAVKLAMQSPTWADGSEAILGSFGAGFAPGPGLWVPAGRQSLKMKWSSAGAGLAAERQFEIRVPPCPTTILDLELPADRVPTSPADALLTGPFPRANDPNLRSWRFRFGDRSRLEFGVRGPSETGSGAAIASLAAKYELAPGQLACTFEYDLHSSRGALAEWVFALSPGLSIVEVVVNDRASWRVDPATRRLHVALRQPAAGGKVVITATAPLPPRGQSAALPTCKPVNSVGSEERLELKVPPDFELERLDAADYRIADSALAPDGTRVTTLVGTLLPAGSNATGRRAPAIRVTAAEAEFTTNEGLDWRIEAGRLHLAARVSVRVRRGPLFRLQFRTPPGFTLDRLSNAPDDIVSYSGVTPTGIEVEFARPLAAGQRVELRLEFRGPQLPPRASQVAFPQFSTLGAGERDGSISFTPGPAWSLVPRPAPGVIAATDLDWPEGAPAEAEVAYPFRGMEPTGTLTLAPVRPEFTAAFETRFDGSGAQVNSTERIALKVKSGELTGLVFFEPDARSSKRTWKLLDGSNAIASADPLDLGGLPSSLPPIGPTAMLSLLAARSIQPAGTYWVVRFVRPLTGEVSLESTAAASRARTNLQFLTVVGATESHWKVDGTPPVAATSTESAAGPRGWTFEGLHLIMLCAESHALAVFGGAVHTRGGSVLPIVMPPGAEVRAACVGGYWLDPGRCELIPTGNGSELRLPIPAGTGAIRFEVRYRMPTPENSRGWVRSPTPVLPGEENSIARWWAFPRGVVAAWPFRLRNHSGDWPVLLGEPLERSAGDLTVSRDPGEAVLIAPTRLADAAGAAFAALLAALAWIGLRRANRTIGVILLVVLTLAGAAHWLGPALWERLAFPLVVVSLVGAAAIATIRGWRTTPTAVTISRGSSHRVAIAVALLIGSFPAIAARAQPTTPREVAFILAGPEPDRETVVVARSALDRLDLLQKKSTPSFVIGAAAYTGRVEDGLARFDVRYVVHAFNDGETTVGLPLAEARLERVNVDGKPAQPIAVRPDSYSIPIVGRGRHEIELRFAVPVTATGPEREVRFGIPELSDSRVAFAAPVTARLLQAVGRLGDQKTATEKDRVRLDVELGGLQTVHLRWREGAAGAAAVSVREGCIWDVAERGHDLTACFQVRIVSGSVTTLRFDLPAGLEPIRVAVRSLDSILGANVLREWSLGKETGGLQPLRIDLNGPTDGRLLVTLECVPRVAPTRQPVLQFPRPVGMTRIDAIYGLRANGVAIESIGRAGVIDFAADVLAREFGSVPDLRLNPAVPVIAFSPRPGEVAELRPAIRRGPELPAVTQDVAWNVGPHRATGHGTIKWTAPEPVSMIDFTLSAAVAEVRAPEVAGWAQTDGRVQVWFRKPLKDGQVEWFGSYSPGPAGKPAPSPLAFEPPIPTVPNVRNANQIVRLRPADGWGVRVERDKGWSAVPTNERVWAFRSEGATVPPRLQLFPPGSGLARGFGLIEFAGTDVVYRNSVEIAIAANRPHHLVLQARELPVGANVALDVPPGTRIHENVNDDGSREWDLDAPAAATTFRATLAVRFAAKGSLELPTIDFRLGDSLPDARGVVRWIGMTGAKRDVRLERAAASSGVELAALQAEWPGEMDRLRRAGGSTWSVPDGTAVLAFASAPPPPAKTSPAEPAPTEAVPSSPSPTTTTPIIAALGWCSAAIGVLVLFVRSPRLTWPEQVGLLGGLFGFAVAGGWVVGVATYAIARIAWLAGLVVGIRR